MDELTKLVKRLPPDQRERVYGFTSAIDKAIQDQFKHKLRLTLAVLIFPGIMGLSVVAYPETIAQVIADLWGVFIVVLLAGILLTTHRGIHLHRRFFLLMSASMALALAMLLPFILFIEVTNRWMAAIVVYNICLALYVIGSFGFYLIVMGINPPKEPYG
jgi:hypothetical protein